LGGIRRRQEERVSRARFAASHLTPDSFSDGKRFVAVFVGTARHIETSKPEMGAGGPVAGKGQSVRVIELPKELERITNADELHRKLGSHIKK
jgi:hypothetical protein